jgi:hypothetical protein
VRSQVEHSNVRSSNPRVPGEMRLSAILCLHVGHIGRSLTKSPITVPHEITGKTELAVLHLSSIGRCFSSAVLIPGNGRRGSLLTQRPR